MDKGPMLITLAVTVLVGGLAGGLGVLILVLLMPKRSCPNCGKPLPRFEKKASKREAFWGGWTCKNCGCKIDSRGRKRNKEQLK